MREYHEFTRLLVEALEEDPRVVGLVALGSMADVDYHPDQWSDHDFFVISEPGSQEYFRNDLSWLPDDRQIAFWFRETTHGLKVVYENGNLLEFAVFDFAELELAKADCFRVLIDRGRIQQSMETIASKSAGDAEKDVADDRLLFGQFLINLMVGVGRYRRGEHLSGDEHVKRFALNHLVTLISKYIPSPNTHLLDRLAPRRRFEFVYPELGDELEQALYMRAPEAAAHLIAISDRVLSGAMPRYPSSDIEIVEGYLLSHK